MAMNRRSYVGRVVSAKMQNTIVVAVARVRHHAVYGKALRRKTMLYVHDPRDESQYGDLVRVVECRPVSKTKRFRLQSIIQRHEVLRPEEVAEFEAVMSEAVEAPATVGVAGESPEANASVEEAAVAVGAAEDEEPAEFPEADCLGDAPDADTEEAAVVIGNAEGDESAETSEAELDGGAPVAEAQAEAEEAEETPPAQDDASDGQPDGNSSEEEHEVVSEEPVAEVAEAEAEPEGAEVVAEASDSESGSAEAETVEAEPENAEVEAAVDAPEGGTEGQSSEDAETPRKEDA